MHIGLLGGGQLSRMLAVAGYPLGLRFTVLDPAAGACAGHLAEHIQAAYDDGAALKRLMQVADVISWDFENVPVDSVERLQEVLTVRPACAALAKGQDRLHEKNLFRELGIDTPEFANVETRPDLLAAIDRIGMPAVLKTRRMGYDGKGQAVLKTSEDFEQAWQKLGGRSLILEQFVPFDCECSIIGVRGANGEIHFYPLTHNFHHRGVLSLSHAPAGLPVQLEQQAREWLQRLFDHFDYIGVLTLELFVTGDRLLVNEMAPRVHNSGHWTIDGAVTSQFENHLRAICGWPLGDPSAHGASLMMNWIGEMPRAEEYLRIPGLHWHDYGKSSRPGRKVGHANLVAESDDQLRHMAQALQPLLQPGQWQRVEQFLAAC